MPHTLPSLPAWLVALFLAVPVAHADNTASLDDWPDWVRDSMENESRRLKYRDVRTPDDSVRTTLPGKPGQPQAIEDGWYFITDIEAESPLECYTLTSGRDLATFASLIADANIDAVGASHGTVGNRRVFHTGAGEVAGLPYLALEWLYTVEKNAELRVGFTKVRVAGKGDTAFACAHNAIGYRETFSEAFARFVNGTETDGAEPTPFYEDIAQIDIGGVAPGIVYSAYSVDEDGGIRAELAQSLIVPVDPSTIMTNDSYSISYTDPDGELLSSFDISVENGDVASDMSLQRNENGAWVSSGTLQGKQIDYEIDGSLEPASEWRQLAAIRDLFAGDKQTVSMLTWIPDADPTRFMDATLTRDDSEVDRQAVLTLGPISLSGRFDESGNVIDGDMSVGPVAMKIERIWFRGSVER